MGKLKIEDVEFGFISPSGEWIACDTCFHEEKAYDFCESLGIDPYDGEKWGYSNGASDVIVKIGWILIHGIGDVTIEIPEDRPLTMAQRGALILWLKKNAKYAKFFDKETIDFLLKFCEEEEKRLDDLIEGEN